MKIGIDKQFQTKQFVLYFILMFISYIVYDYYLYSKVTDEYIGNVKIKFVYNNKFTNGSFRNNGRVLLVGCNGNISDLRLPICDTGGIYLKESIIDFYNVNYKVIENRCKKKNGDILCPIHIQQATIISDVGEQLLTSNKKPMNNMEDYMLKLFGFLFFPTIFAFAVSVLIVLLEGQFKEWRSK